jgi:UDP-N-acetylmuramoylalanine--D-glutamate ligase
VELKNKRVMVLGLGVSGVAAAHLLAARGAALIMADQRVDLACDRLPAGEVHLGEGTPEWLSGVSLVVTSPGVPPSSTLMRAARTAQIPVIGELELGARFVTAPLVAVTGTNGKSTVTELLGEIFATAGMRTFVGGNLGTPLSAAGGDFDVAVVEVSSYQLETIERFKPRVAIHLNLTADHLDRYDDLEAYGRAKERIFLNQDTTDWAVLNRDDPAVWKLAARTRAQVFSFGRERPPSGPAVWSDGDRIAFDDVSERSSQTRLLAPLRSAGARVHASDSISLKKFRLPGTHNRLNAMAAAAGARAMQIAPAVIERALANFAGLPHRLEFVGEKAGVLYVDDSKGTNVGAVVEALAAVAGPVVLIAGGVDKGGDYAPLRAALANKVRLLFLLGAAREKMRDALAGATTIECVDTLAGAVARAAAGAQPGETVLLSPACSSFDQFKDYAERGRIFQKLVRAL